MKRMSVLAALSMVTLLAATTAIVAVPLAHKFSQGWPLEGLGGPPVVARGFDLGLAAGERFAALTDAIPPKDGRYRDARNESTRQYA